ncbi:MAG: hypothetical protein H6608_01300 [Flavobacteriales bacterium]|nr:hypothetical protein [Bacteroidota bacterium]MCB9239742.1 hypothetical protein [Flavobacteriales bacterium]
MSAYTEQDIANLVHRSNWEQAAQVCARDPESMASMVNCMLYGNLPARRRAAEVVRIASDTNYSSVEKHVPSIARRLAQPADDGIIRNCLHVLQFAEIPEDESGLVYDRCTELFSDPKQPAAIRVFAMTVLYKIAQPYPELLDELFDQIREQLKHPTSAGFQNRAGKILRKTWK